MSLSASFFGVSPPKSPILGDFEWKKLLNWGNAATVKVPQFWGI
ncbi:hypothetical protein NIES2104_55200 [Leptolyngbya sp. NIES-2104]|nr:hypothetical protein NIES2104_55200 [Leptolyngbya sp. NIES-2104]